jgi:hypothetical protein
MSTDEKSSKAAAVPPMSGATGTLKPWLVFLAVGLLLAAIWAVGRWAAEPKTTGADAAATLALIAAVAVGIERVIASGWALLDQTRFAWWPFRQMGEEVGKLLTSLDEQLRPIYAEGEKVIGELSTTAGASLEAVEAAKKGLADVQARIRTLQGAAPNSQRLNLIAASAIQALGYVEQADQRHQLTANLRLANQALAGLTDFVGSFRDNPGRRLVSIYAGALLGLGVAAILGLDLFLAIFGRPPNSGGLVPYLGVVLTGLVIGLGSNPTHEVISVLQEIKKQRAAQNQPGPADGGAVVVPAPPLAKDAGFQAPGAETFVYYPPIRRFR